MLPDHSPIHPGEHRRQVGLSSRLDFLEKEEIVGGDSFRGQGLDMAIDEEAIAPPAVAAGQLAHLLIDVSVLEIHAGSDLVLAVADDDRLRRLLDLHHT